MQNCVDEMWRVYVVVSISSQFDFWCVLLFGFLFLVLSDCAATSLRSPQRLHEAIHSAAACMYRK